MSQEQRRVDDMMDQFWELIPEEGVKPPIKEAFDNIKHFGREAFSNDEAYEYHRWFLNSLHMFFCYCFANGIFPNIEDWTILDEPGKVGADDLNPAVACLLTEFISDPVGMLENSRSAIEELFSDGVPNPSKVPALITQENWSRLPDPLELWHVAALIQTTPKNVRNIVQRDKDFPPRIIKPKHRKVNFAAQWKKAIFLSYVQEHYSHLYE